MTASRRPRTQTPLGISLAVFALVGASTGAQAAQATPADFVWPTTPVDRGACPAPKVSAQPGNGSLTTGASGAFALDTAPRFVNMLMADGDRNAAQPNAVTAPFYRIPGLEVTNNGTLVGVWDGRPSTKDLPSNIVQLVRTSTDQGSTWTPQRVYRGNIAPHGYGDPSLLVDRDSGRLFSFYTHGINAGLVAGKDGNSALDDNAPHLTYSWSDDNGATWSSRDISAVKPPQWKGVFFASGAGIQLQQGDCAGRLINQMVARLPNGNLIAASVYSDDHGLSWHMGQATGEGMADENKVVELSDGRLMLNSRASNTVKRRYVAYSSDGGYSYSDFKAVDALPDPHNNGHILRVHPNAAPGTPDARLLMFVNTNSEKSRANLTVRLSCDDGATWPVSRVVTSGAAAYSVLQKLNDGSFGLLWETDNSGKRIQFGRFNAAWLGSCSGATVGAQPVLSKTFAPDALPAAAAVSAPRITPFTRKPAADAIRFTGTGTPGSTIFARLTNTETAPAKDVSGVTEVNTNGRWQLDFTVPGAGRYQIALSARNGSSATSATVTDRFNAEDSSLTPSLGSFSPLPRAHSVPLSGKGKVGSVVQLVIKPFDGRPETRIAPSVTAAGTWSATADLPAGRYLVEYSASQGGLTSRTQVDRFNVLP